MLHRAGVTGICEVSLSSVSLPLIRLCAYTHKPRRNILQVGRQALFRCTFNEPLYSGIFPCFLGGFLSRLVSSIFSARIRCPRVSLGRITAST